MPGDKMLWGGRFAAGPHPEMVALTASVDVDVRLVECDIAATRAHARVLEAAGLLEEDERRAVEEALGGILSDFRSGAVTAGPADEDVHSLVERLLTERLGGTGRRIHAGRSRNDLVATDFRMWCRDAADDLVERCVALIEGLSDAAERHSRTVMPGYTHLQRAQPVTLGFHLLAHGFALERDARRFAAARVAADVSSLGAGAIAGTTLPLDPLIAAAELGFARVFDNAMDAISDRDFACDLVYASALCGVHLSRLAEEIVLWTSSEFGFARLSDEWSTGSSMMPQKRNPDLAELVRGRAAGGIGDLSALLGMLKGLPLAYNRDLQEDKRSVFCAVDRVAGCLAGMSGLLPALSFDADRMAGAAAAGAAWATDLAEALVMRGVPFRDAHEATGALVARLERSNLELQQAGVEALRAHHERFEPRDVEAADPGTAVARRNRRGGPAPEQVHKQAEHLRVLASEHRRQ